MGQVTLELLNLLSVGLARLHHIATLPSMVLKLDFSTVSHLRGKRLEIDFFFVISVPVIVVGYSCFVDLKTNPPPRKLG